VAKWVAQGGVTNQNKKMYATWVAQVAQVAQVA